MGIGSWIIVGWFLKCKSDQELVADLAQESTEEIQEKPEGGFIHPNLTSVLEGVWVTEKPKQEQAISDMGVRVLNDHPNVLVAGGGKNPDIIAALVPDSKTGEV